MTPKQKAKELVGKFIHHAESFHDNHHAKQCALICVDEILKELKRGNIHRGTVYKYWQEVKQEIEKL